MNLKHEKAPSYPYDHYLEDQIKENEKPYRKDGRHEKCPAGAVKIKPGVYDCGNEIFVGDRL